MTEKPGGTSTSFLGDLSQSVDRDAGLDRSERETGREAGPGPAEAAVRLRLAGASLDFFEDLLHFLGKHLGDRLGLFARELAGQHELLGVELADADPILDLFVHDRLGERRLVALVVPVAAVADHVDHDVLAEGLPEVERQLADVNDGLGILAVDVEDRHLDHLGDVGAIPGRSALAGGRREADLVVDDDVDRAAGAISGQLREVQRLGDQPLPCERGIAVDQDRDAEPAVPVLEPALLGPHSPLDDRVDRLQVAGVGR